MSIAFPFHKSFKYKFVFHYLALTPKDFCDFFQTIFKQAVDLRNQWEARGDRVPRVMVGTVMHIHTDTYTCVT